MRAISSLTGSSETSRTGAEKRRKIKRMLAGLRRDAGAPAEWSVYIAQCKDGSYYTGVAKDILKRLAAHNAGKGAAYTRSRRPIEILYSESGLTRSQALVREAGIKSLSRLKKSELAARSS